MEDSDDTQLQLIIPTESYKPKRNHPWARLPNPLTLRSLALRNVINWIGSLDISKNDEDVAKNHLNEYMHRELPQELLDLAYSTLVKPKSILNLFRLLPRKYTDSCQIIDLIGFYRGTECCRRDRSTCWIYGYVPDICLQTKSCNDLFNLLESQDIEKLECLKFWADERAIIESNLPYHIMKATNLRELYIRGDADDHLLRVIGEHCNSLKILDVARSPRIGKYGILNMLLAQRLTRRDDNLEDKDIVLKKRRSIAARLESLTITHGTSTGFKRNHLISKILHRSYVTPKFPEIIFTTRTKPGLIKRNIRWTRGSYRSEELSELFQDWLSIDCWSNVEEILRTILNPFPENYLDVWEDNESENIRIIATPNRTWTIRCIIDVHPTDGIQKMYQYWKSYNWEVQNILPIPDLVNYAPNIKHYEGRLCSFWSGTNHICNKLKVLSCWTLDDITIISLLQTCPNLEIFEVKNVRTVTTMLNGEQFIRLNHTVLVELIQQNPSVWTNLREFIVRPTNLRKASVELIASVSPKLERIGDLECWDVTERDIAELNKFLYDTKSRCQLVVLSFPPTQINS